MKRLAIRPESWITFTVLFVFGVVVCVGSLRYHIGSLRSMGPGYFPMLLGVSLCAISVLILIEDAFVREQSERGSKDTQLPRISRNVVRILLGILGSILAFALSIKTLGLVPATLACSAIAFSVNTHSRLVESIIISFLVSAFTAVVFVYGLGIPVRLVAF